MKSLPRPSTDSDMWVPDHLTPSWVCLPNDQPVLTIIKPGESVLCVLETICKVARFSCRQLCRSWECLVDCGKIQFVRYFPFDLSNICYRHAGPSAGPHQALPATQVPYWKPSAILHSQTRGGRVRPGTYGENKNKNHLLLLFFSQSERCNVTTLDIPLASFDFAKNSPKLKPDSWKVSWNKSNPSILHHIIRTYQRQLVSQSAENDTRASPLSVTHSSGSKCGEIAHYLYNYLILFSAALQRNWALLQDHKSNPVRQRWVLHDRIR